MGSIVLAEALRLMYGVKLMSTREQLKNVSLAARRRCCAMVLLCALVLSLPLVAYCADPGVPIEITSSNKTSRFLAIDDIVSFRTAAGRLSFRLSDLRSIRRGTNQLEDLHVTTSHGDAWAAALSTKYLQYYGESRTLKLTLKKTPFDSIRIALPASSWAPQEHAAIELPDGSRACVNVAGVALPLKNSLGQWNMPLGCLKEAFFGERKDANIAIIAFPGGYEETFELPGSPTLSLLDTFGNALRVNALDIVRFDGRAGIADNRGTADAARMRRPPQRMPTVVWNVKGTCGDRMIPTPLLRGIEKRADDSHHELRTVFGETFHGRVLPRSFRMPTTEGEKPIKVSLDELGDMWFPHPQLEVPDGWLAWVLKTGEMFYARPVETHSLYFVGMQKDSGDRPMNSEIVSLAPARTRERTISLRRKLKYRAVFKDGSSEDVGPIASSVPVVQLCNGAPCTIPWKLVEAVAGSIDEAMAIAAEPPAIKDKPEAAEDQPEPQPEEPLPPAPDETNQVNVVSTTNAPATEVKQPSRWSRLFGRNAKPQPEEPKSTTPDSVAASAPETTSPAVTNVIAPETAEPTLRPGLVLTLTVTASGRQEVNEPKRRVSASGTITLPLIGSIKVDGLTIEQLSRDLTKAYAEYLHNPMVDVDFVIDESAGAVSPWGYVTVLGRVKQPGRIGMPPTLDLSLSMAIQLAGGLDTSAKLKGIKITRKTNGKGKQFHVNLQAVGADGHVESDVKLKAGDIVYVPQRMF